MRATVMYGAGDVRVDDVPDAKVKAPTDAVVRVRVAGICGSDLHPYHSMPSTAQGRQMGHEFIGVVDDVGSTVSGLNVGDLVISPFLWEDNTCDFCREGLQSSCRHGGRYGFNGVDGGQGEAVRVPQAQGTLIKLPVAEDSALMPSLLTLTDVFCTGHHCALKGGVGPQTTSVLVIGDGAVGLCAVLAARRLGAEQILVMGSHHERTDLGREFGATDVIAERGEEGMARARELTGGDGARVVLECVGSLQALDTSFGAVRDGGVVSRAGVPQYDEGPIGFDMLGRNITLTGGATPARAYIEELMPEVLNGTIEPGRVFDRTIELDDVPDGYRAMADRQALKVLIDL
jgi:threonine dehydrogenase-like Zn-dependent dehydrogenase